jgi:glycosyltransferase involved in cell wall biosynthesis
VPTVSVIASAYNQEVHIHQAIQSVLTQPFRDIELIVTEDASTDGTLDVINLFSGDARLRILRNAVREGEAASLSRALSVSQGKYIAWLGCNDVFERHHLETLVPFLANNPDKIGVFGLASCINTGSDITGSWSDAGVKSDRFQLLNLMFRHAQPFCNSAVLLHRDKLAESNHLKSEFGKCYDAALWVSLLFDGDLEVIPETVVRARNPAAPSASDLNRLAFEKFELLNIFARNIASAELLLKIFPEVEDVNLPVTDELVDFHLALLALSCEDTSSRLFGLHLLHNALKKSEVASVLKSECGFTYHDLFDFEDDSDIFASGGIQLEIDKLKQKLEEALGVTELTPGGPRLNPVPGKKVNYLRFLPEWIPIAGTLLPEGPHPEAGIPFVFYWCCGPTASVKLTCEKAGPHVLVIETQNLHFPALNVLVKLNGIELAELKMRNKRGHDTDIFQTVLQLEPGLYELSFESDKWQESEADPRKLAFMIKNIRLWECL